MSTRHPKQSHFWQGLLLLLPILILVTIGLISLRQDKSLAEIEAKERAQAIAADLAERIWVELGESFFVKAAKEKSDGPSRGSDIAPRRVSFIISPAGELLDPPPAEAAPLPRSLDLSGLNDQQRVVWQRTQATDWAQADTGEIVEAYRQFLATAPADNFRARAEFALGVLWQSNQPDAAQKMFESVIQVREAVSESGLPLSQLALFKLSELWFKNPAVDSQRRSEILETLSSNAVTQPTPLSSYFLQQVAQWQARYRLENQSQTNWLQIWTLQEKSRELYKAARKQLLSRLSRIPRLETAAFSPDGRRIITWTQPIGPLEGPDEVAFWFNDGQQNWLASIWPQKSGEWEVMCGAEGDIRLAITQQLNKQKNIPDYFGIGLALAGKSLIGVGSAELRRWKEVFHGGKGTVKQKEFLDPLKFQPELLASEAKILDGLKQLEVTVYLTSPEVLFARQRARLFWFSALIVASAVAALIGLVTTWAAFNRQRRLNELKSNFVSSVSHELRAPIASVRLLAESLEKGRVQGVDKQNEYFRFIVQECRRLSSMIQNVLDFSRIEQGRKEYEFEVTDLHALIEQTTNIMQPYALERGLKIKTELPETMIAAVCDPRAMEQALINLIDNAIKHSAEGTGITIGLEADSVEDADQQKPNPESGKIRIWVEDQGEGIPLDEQTRIFDRFYRVGQELRRKTQGIGIGLSIVKDIVEAHEGQITVNSRPGAGSRFTIELPAKRDGNA